MRIPAGSRLRWSTGLLITARHVAVAAAAGIDKAEGRPCVQDVTRAWVRKQMTGLGTGNPRLSRCRHRAVSADVCVVVCACRGVPSPRAAG